MYLHAHHRNTQAGTVKPTCSILEHLNYFPWSTWVNVLVLRDVSCTLVLFNPS